MSEALFKLLTGIGGLSGVAALVICYMAYRLVTSEKEARTRETEERKKLTSKVDALEHEKFTELKQKIDNHIAADKSQKILTKLEEMEKTASERQKRIDGSIEVLTAKVDRSLQRNEAQEAQIAANKGFIENLREDMQSHINFCNGRSHHQ